MSACEKTMFDLSPAGPVAVANKFSRGKREDYPFGECRLKVETMGGREVPPRGGAAVAGAGDLSLTGSRAVFEISGSTLRLRGGRRSAVVGTVARRKAGLCVNSGRGVPKAAPLVEAQM